MRYWIGYEDCSWENVTNHQSCRPAEDFSFRDAAFADVEDPIPLDLGPEDEGLLEKYVR